MKAGRATVFVPGSIGNVGPGFDVLGLAVEGAGDTVTVELTGGSFEVAVEGKGAAVIPTDPDRNSASIAAAHYLRSRGYGAGARIAIRKGLAVSAGLGGSAASAVGGAVAAAFAFGGRVTRRDLLESALEGETAVAGRHLDNVAASLCGGLTLSLSVSPPHVVEIPLRLQWWIALVTPAVEIRTREARAVLPVTYDRAAAVQQVANACGVVCGMQSGDADLLRRAFTDLFAEPYRAALIPHFQDVKAAALAVGALASTISGAGPTMFALATEEGIARRAADAMREAFAPVGAEARVTTVSAEGARRIE